MITLSVFVLVTGVLPAMFNPTTEREMWPQGLLRADARQALPVSSVQVQEVSGSWNVQGR